MEVQAGRQKRRGWMEAVGVFVVWPAAPCFYPYSFYCSHLCSHFPLNHTLLFNGHFVVYTFVLHSSLSVLCCIFVNLSVSNKHTFLVFVLVCVSCFVPFQNTHFLVTSFWIWVCVFFVFCIPFVSCWSFHSAAAYWFYACCPDPT